MPTITTHPVETLKISELNFADYNPRDWDAESEEGLTASLNTFGVINLPTVNRRTWDDNKLVIIGGHYRIHCLKKSNQDSVQCIVVQFNELQEKEANLALNSPEISGKFNNKVFDILDYLRENSSNFGALKMDKLELSLKPLLISGFNSIDRDKDIDFEKLENEFLDGVEKDQRTVLTQAGDVYQVQVDTGNKQVLIHNLVCKNSIDEDLSTWGADLVFTDPPYGVNITKASKTSPINNGKYPEIVGDRDTNFAQLFYLNCQKSGFKDYIIWGYNYFAHFLPPTRGMIIWDKACPDGMSFADGELAGIVARDADSAWISKDRNMKIYHQAWMGNMEHRASKDNFVAGKRIHPTQKPVEVQTQIVKDIYPDAKKILDGFAGSGSTLLVSQILGKEWVGYEIIPHYCDMVLIRFVQFLERRKFKFQITKNGQELTADEMEMLKT